MTDCLALDAISIITSEIFSSITNSALKMSVSGGAWNLILNINRYSIQFHRRFFIQFKTTFNRLCKKHTGCSVSYQKPMLRILIRDPVPFWPLDPGSRMGKKSGSGKRDEPGSYFRELRNNILVKILKFLDADPVSGTEKIRIRDPR